MMDHGNLMLNRSSPNQRHKLQLHQQDTRTSKTARLWFLPVFPSRKCVVVIVLVVQCLVIYKATTVHHHIHTTYKTSKNSNNIQNNGIIGNGDNTEEDEQVERYTTSYISNPIAFNQQQQQTHHHQNHINTSNHNSYIPLTNGKTRMLIGIISSAGNHMGRVYRNRHRRLFDLWNDTRLCSLHDFIERATTNVQSLQPMDVEVHEHDIIRGTVVHDESVIVPCQLIYTFVISGNPNGTTSILQQDENNLPSLTVPSDQIPILPRYKDALLSDVTILNIKENMNHGKTPTYFYFAYQNIMKVYPDVQYILKCDSDAILRLGSLLKFVNTHLPTTTTADSSSSSAAAVDYSTYYNIPPILIGSLRHKSYWSIKSSNQLIQQYESYWQAEYHNGLHLYLAGQCYGLSYKAIELLLQQARQIPPTPLGTENFTYTNDYLEGHEDHDATSMIMVSSILQQQQQHRHHHHHHQKQETENIDTSSSLSSLSSSSLSSSSLRWIDMARHYRYWEHPVKGEFWWKKIWRREMKKKNTTTTTTTTATAIGATAKAATVRVNPVMTRPPRVLLFFLDSSDPNIRQTHRQNLLRQHQQQDDNHHSVCSLTDFITKYQQQERIDQNESSSSTKYCEVVYTFVVGGNPNGPKQMLHDDPSLPLIIKNNKDVQVDGTTSTTSTEHEDILVFNIRYVVTKSRVISMVVDS